MRRALRWLWRSGAVLLALLVALGVGGWLWLRSSLPQLDGTIALRGLHGPVEIARDEHGIAYVRAGSEHDAQFALGFLHAQDRLAQMELTRRVGAGRLAEIAGAGALGSDRAMRTFGLPELAERDAETLPQPVRDQLQAYTAGVNAFLATRRGALPPEFYLLWHTPEPWTVADTLRWGRLMAFRLTDNLGAEMLRARLAARLPPERVAALWPDYPADGATTIAAQQPLPRRSDAEHGQRHAAIDPTLFGDIPGVLPDGRPSDGSNEWALAGAHTTTGKPILANDPHLGFAVPNHWYLVRIDVPGGTLAGATAPGSPFLVLGHNDRVAWGLTTTHGDAADLFRERTVAGDPTRYETPDGPRPIETRTETIGVGGGEPVMITVRRTRHGPVVSDIYADAASAAGLPGGEIVALAHTALLPGDANAQALYGANRAGTVAEFREAARAFRAPQQNVLVVDRDGAIALEMPGLIPIRRSGDGRIPALGWDGSADWVGFVPFEQRPRTADPPSGRIVNANNRLVPPGWPYFVARDWPPPYRAQRIEAVLAERQSHAVEDSASLALDTLSLGAGEALDALLTADAGSDRGRRALSMLRQWDRRMDRTRPEPLVYAAWVREAMRALFADELGAEFTGWWANRPLLLQRTARDDRSWCDDILTTPRETCPGQFAAALERALDRLERDYGTDPAAWRWGRAHQARFDHPLFSRLPWIGRWATLRIENDGGDFTVNQGGMRFGNEDAPFEQVHGPGYRAVYDLADLDRSLFIQAVGQSGNPFSPHYADLLPLWRDGKYLRLVRPEKPAHMLRLEPVEAPR